MMPSRTLPVSDDVIRLRWTRTGLFIVKSAYEQLTKTNYGQSFKNIWKPKIPKKKTPCGCQRMMQFLLRITRLEKAEACNENETSCHLFLKCKVVRSNQELIACIIGANCVPDSIQKCWIWLKKWLMSSFKDITPAITSWEGHDVPQAWLITTPRWAWSKSVREGMCYAYDFGELLVAQGAM